MKRNRYYVYWVTGDESYKINCASVSDGKSYISGNRDKIFTSDTDTVSIIRGKELYGKYILYNGRILEVQKGDFRK